MSPFDVAWTLLKEDDIYEQLPNSAWYSDFGEEWLQSQDPSYREFLQREAATEKRLKDMEEGNAPRPFAEFDHGELLSLGFNGPFLQTPEQRQALTDEMRLRTPDAEQQMLSQQPFDFDFQDKLASEPFDLAWTMVHQNRR